LEILLLQAAMSRYRRSGGWYRRRGDRFFGDRSR
jgi:hypothetical protein